MNAVDQTPPVVLTIAGTDSGGAAGIAADLATIGHLGAHGACVITAVTAQDTLGVHAVHPVPLDVVAAQLDAVFDDLPVAAVKTGMLGSAEVVELVARHVRRAGVPLVVDPVLVATSGAVLGDRDVVRAYLDHLLAHATVSTPNVDEAHALAGWPGAPSGASTGAATARELAGVLAAAGLRVLVTGGEHGSDWLAVPGDPLVELVHDPVPTPNDHGTGCTHSSALATHLAHGLPLAQAAVRAAAYTGGQLVTGSAWRLGRGRGPVAHTSPGSTPTSGRTSPSSALPADRTSVQSPTPTTGART